MKYDPEFDLVHLCDDVLDEPERPFSDEDLQHMRDIALEFQSRTGATALPGLEAVYRQIQWRIARERNYVAIVGSDGGGPLKDRARRAVVALREPDHSLQRVPNTVRQSIADVIEALLATAP